MALAVLTFIPIALMCTFIGFLYEASSIAVFFFITAVLAILPLVVIALYGFLKWMQNSR